MTANNQVEGECLAHNIDNNITGAINRNAHTISARACLFLKKKKKQNTFRYKQNVYNSDNISHLEGFLAALSDIRIGATVLCKKCKIAVTNKHKFRHSRMNLLSGEREVSPVCKANI